MPRRPNIEPSVGLHIKIPISMKARLDLILYSEDQGRIPFGAHQKLILELLTQFFDRLEEAQK